MASHIGGQLRQPELSGAAPVPQETQTQPSEVDAQQPLQR